MFFGGDPFEHFAHHGGGGGSRRSRGPPADVDTTKLYETLGVSSNTNRTANEDTAWYPYGRVGDVEHHLDRFIK